jgi:hypothetical protein
MLINTYLWDVYYNPTSTSWVFSHADVGTYGPPRWATSLYNRGILQIISIILFNFVCTDSLYAEGCVDIQVKSNYSTLFSPGGGGEGGARACGCACISRLQKHVWTNHIPVFTTSLQNNSEVTLLPTFKIDF